MVPDAEVLKVLTEILDDLDLGDYEVKLNHRKLLDAMLAIAGAQGWRCHRSGMAAAGGRPATPGLLLAEFPWRLRGLTPLPPSNLPSSEPLPPLPTPSHHQNHSRRPRPEVPRHLLRH